MNIIRLPILTRITRARKGSSRKVSKWCRETTSSRWCRIEGSVMRMRVAQMQFHLLNQAWGSRGKSTKSIGSLKSRILSNEIRLHSNYRLCLCFRVSSSSQRSLNLMLLSIPSSNTTRLILKRSLEARQETSLRSETLRKFWRVDLR